MSQVTHHRWSDVPAEPINPSISRQFITADRVTVARFRLTCGGIVPLHAHDSEQLTFVMSGALKFMIEGREIIVKSGEVLQIPGGVAHSVEVVEDTLAVDVFSPVRQDWVDKTDDYFRR